MFLTLLLTLLLLPCLQTWQAHSPGLYHPVSAHFVVLGLSIELVLTLVVNLIFRLFPLFPMISLAYNMFFWIPLVCLAFFLSKFCNVSCKISPVGHYWVNYLIWPLFLPFLGCTSVPLVLKHWRGKWEIPISVFLMHKVSCLILYAFFIEFSHFFTFLTCMCCCYDRKWYLYTLECSI
jgi:hypothetical protein